MPDEVATRFLGMYEGIAEGRFAREAAKEQRRGTVSLAAAVERIVSNFQSA